MRPRSGPAAEDRRRLHAAVAAGRGQGAGILLARGSAAEHADQARVRMYEDAVQSAERFVGVRHILIKHAKAAGVDAPYLGSHVLRHSNAARQVDLGIRPRVLSDLLGHRDRSGSPLMSGSPLRTLRDVSLPVPA